VGVNQVEALAAQQLAQAPYCRDVVAFPPWELEDLDLDPTLPNLFDLIVHPAPPLWSPGIRHEIGDDQHAHGLSVSASASRKGSKSH
jgi:hypothetical protein